MENEISPAVLERAKKLMAKDEEKATKRSENLGKYPHAKADTLQFDIAANKYSVEITCTECGAEDRRVFTSDLFQVTTCEACAKKAKKAKKDAKKAEIEEAKAYLASQKSE